MTPSVLITAKIPRTWVGNLEKYANVVIWDGNKFLMPRDHLLEVIGQYEALINFAEVNADEQFVAKASRLRIIANCSIGFDKLDLPKLTANGIWASNAPGFFNYPVAEYVLTGILVLLRRLHEADAFVRQGNWYEFEPGRWDGFSLREKTVGIIGMGSIGKILKSMLNSLGVRVIHTTRFQRSHTDWVPLSHLLCEADIISLHVPLTSDTRNLIDFTAFQSMRPGAILVNTSRGEIVDQEALLKALVSGHLGGAVLDVFQKEPDVPHELFKMKNVLLTPHIAGGTFYSRKLCVNQAGENVSAVLNHKKPPNALNHIQ